MGYNIMKVSNFQFRTPVLVQMEFEVNPEFDTDYNFNLDKSFESEISLSENENKATVILRLTVNSEENTPFKLVIAYLSEFIWEEGYSDELLKDLLEINAPALILSYMRPIVSSVTSASPLPSFEIPFLDFTNDENRIKSNL